LKLHRRITILILILLVLAAAAQAARSPRNVILMIGDGMGFAQVTMARLSLNGKPLKMDSMRSGGMAKTHSANAIVTDSAAAGTALATGFKTNNGMVGVTPDGKPVQTILEAAQKMRKAAGLVTTTTITHATPASFGSHVSSRSSEAEIAPQYIDRKIDVLMGGGKQFFLPKSVSGSKRSDERDLLSEARKLGYTQVDSLKSWTDAKSGRLIGLFELDAMTTNPPEPSLAQMTTKAIEALSKDPQGFFLMVEGGQIDWQSHSHNARGTIRQTLDFDDAIGEALEFAMARKDTLVIVTADHETGGLTLVGGTNSFEPSYAKWSTTGHTGVNVPVLADGPGADMFGGVLDNTDIPKRIARLWGVKAFAVQPR
jgi:alkaline phosphatase